jgi:hypothetical protein
MRNTQWASDEAAEITQYLRQYDALDALNLIAIKLIAVYERGRCTATPATQENIPMPQWQAKGSAVFAGNDCIAVCDTGNATKSVYENHARLMAAASDLLDVLKTYNEFPANAEERIAWLKKRYAAIAKAEGIK